MKEKKINKIANTVLRKKQNKKVSNNFRPIRSWENEQIKSSKNVEVNGSAEEELMKWTGK